MMRIPTAPAPSPVFGIFSAVLNIIGALLGIGGADNTAQLQQQMQELSFNTQQATDQLSRFANKIARALGKVLVALHAVWQWLQIHVLQKIQDLATRVGRIIDKVLKPYLDFMMKIRKAIMDIYNRFFRPIIQLIESMRRVLAIFKLFHMKWAQRLDARLARLEGRVMSPILALLKHTSVAGSWLNLLLTVKYTLQRPIFVRTLWAYQGDVVNTFWASQSLFPPAAAPAVPTPPTIQETGLEATQNLKDFLTAGSGPFAASIQDSLQSLKSQPSV